ncbi:hypothetical protein EAE90_08690 [Photorhabdus caribbeanensis]|nr:hypothetical protein [Photorhabdus caribbeanensis]
MIVLPGGKTLPRGITGPKLKLDIKNLSDNLSGFGGAVGLNKAGTSLVVGAGPIKLGSESEAGAVYVFENIK